MKAGQQRGLTIFEFSVVLAVIGAIAAIGLQRYIELQELAEKAQVEATLRNIQSGLAQEMARRIIAGQDGQVDDMVGSNPVRWLARPPERYQGESIGVAQELPPGAWRFDLERKELHYQPNFSRNLYLEGGTKSLRWQVRRPKINEPRPFLAPVGVMAVAPYQWF